MAAFLSTFLKRCMSSCLYVLFSHSGDLTSLVYFVPYRCANFNSDYRFKIIDPGNTSTMQICWITELNTLIGNLRFSFYLILNYLLNYSSNGLKSSKIGFK